MQHHLQRNLLIVSDTAMTYDQNNNVIAFEPVIREIEGFAHLFNKITWIGYNKSDEKHIKQMRKIQNVNIEYILLQKTGGRTFMDKLEILTKMVPYFFLIYKQINIHEVVHTRAPSMPAFLAIIISFFDRKRVYWHKYAGDWETKNAPLFYKLQRYLLKKATNTHVTINGNWEGQEAHILSFENPCLTEDEYKMSKAFVQKRSFDGAYNFCFIGNLNDAKGVGRIIEAFKKLNNNRIGTIHFIGDGPKRKDYERQSRSLPVKFHGYLLREQIQELLPAMHFLLLPSASEGFPKVVAEASSFGVIPIVSSVSSLPQYIQDEENGFLIKEVSSESLVLTIQKVLDLDKSTLKSISEQSAELPKKFTYTYYNDRIRNEILKETR